MNDLQIVSVNQGFDFKTLQAFSQAPHAIINPYDDIEAIKIWLTEFKDSSSTFISYRQTAERFLLWLNVNNLTLATTCREHTQLYQDFLQNPCPHDFWCGSPTSRNNPKWRPFVKGLSVNSINLNIQVLNAMYKYLIEIEYLKNNPFKLIRRKNTKVINAPVQHYLTKEQWEYIKKYIEQLPKNTEKQIKQYYRTKWILSLLYFSGFRRSEIVNARMSDFFIKHNKWWLKVIGKGNKYGEVPVTNSLLEELTIYRQSLGLTLYPSSLEEHIPLVGTINSNGQDFITDSMLYKTIKNICNDVSAWVLPFDPIAANVFSKVSTHWLRHTCATHQVDAGIDIRVVKANLRHSLLETTMRYQHTEDNKRHAETIQKFDA